MKCRNDVESSNFIHVVHSKCNLRYYHLCQEVKVEYGLTSHQVGSRWLGGLLVERRTSVSQIRGSIPRQVAAV